MLRLRIIFVLMLSTVAWSSATEDRYYSHETTPKWVDPQHVPIKTPPSNQRGIWRLLIDTQRNVEEKAYYRHFADMMLTQSAIENSSKIEITFDPAFSQVIVHDIRVYRDGKWYDRLQSAHHKLLQRETELDDNIYDGLLSLVYFLEDIRVGDILEYSYTRVGDMEFISSYYTDAISLQKKYSIEKIFYRLLAKPDLEFAIRNVSTEIAPKIQDVSPSLREWIWEVTGTPIFETEQNRPIWYKPAASVQMSQYRSWEEVVRDVLPLFSLPEGNDASDMQALVKQWKQSSSSISEQALLAIRFVQDNIRYLGFENGMGAFKPTSPHATLQRRYGDCKDKAFLLHALLKEMDISSEIVLVHTRARKALIDILPTPLAFNHVVLRFELDGKKYYVDPTCYLQGGTLEKNVFPDYEYGLVLAAGSSTLTTLPKLELEHPIELRCKYSLTKEGPTHLSIKTTFYGVEAEAMRRYLEWYGTENASQKALRQMQQTHGIVLSQGTAKFSDRRDENILTTYEKYALPSLVIKPKERLDLWSHTLRDCMVASIDPKRTSPYALEYPFWIKEEVYVDSPHMDLMTEKNFSTEEHDAFQYTSTSEITKDYAYITYELKHLKDHVPSNTLKDFCQKIETITHRDRPQLNVLSPADPNKKKNILLFCSCFVFALWVIMHVIYRKKPASRSEAEFRIRKAHIFYFVMCLFSVMPLGYSGITAGTIISCLLTIPILYLVYVRQMYNLISLIQAWTILHTFVGIVYIFARIPAADFTHKLAVMLVYGVFAATINMNLSKFKAAIDKELNLITG